MIGFGISTHNRKQQSLECLAAVWKYASRDSIIIVGDDCSQDNTADAIEDWILHADLPRMTILKSSEPLGISKNKKRIVDQLLAINSVTEIILIEDDVVPVQDRWYERFTNTARVNGEPHLLYLPTDTNYGPTKREDAQTRHAIQWKLYCSAMVMYFRASLLREVGSFNPSFSRYGWEHNELTARCLLAAMRDPGGPYPHCVLAETENCLLAKDIENKKLGQPEDSTCGSNMQKMAMAKQNSGIYNELMRGYRTRYSDIERLPEAQKAAIRFKYFESKSVDRLANQNQNVSSILV